MATEIASAYLSLYARMPGVEKDISDALGSSAVKSATSSEGKNIGQSLLSGLGTVVKGGALAIGTVAAAGIGVALTKGFSRLKAIDEAKAKLEGLGHETSSVDQIMQNALASVRGTAYGMDAAATVAASTVAAGVAPGQDLERTLKLVADAATIAGTDMGSMGSIFNKVATSNKIQGDSIAQLSDAGIPVVQFLAKQLGITGEEVVDLASKGKISFAQFQDAMQAGLGGAALSSGKTFSGALNNIFASLSRIGAGLLGGIFPKLAPLFQAITTALAPVEAQAGAIGEAIGKAMGPWIDSMTAWIAAIDFAKVQAGVSGLYDLIVKGDFTGKMREAFNLEEDSQTVAIILGIRNGVSGLYDLIVNGNFSSALRDAFNLEEDSGFVDFVLGAREAVGTFFASLSSGDLSGAVGSIGASLQTLSPALSAFGAQLPAIGQATATLAASGITVLTNVLAFLADNVDTIIASMPLIVAGFAIWKVATAGVVGAQMQLQAAQLVALPVNVANNAMRLQIARTELQVAAATGTSTAATNGGVLAMVRSTAAAVASRTALIATAVAQRTMAVAQAVATAAQWAFNAALTANPIGLIIAAIVALVAGLVWFFTQTDLGKEIWAGFIGFITDGINGFLAWWNPVWAGISQFFIDAWNNMVLGVQIVWNFIVTYVQTYIAILVAVITAVVQTIVNIWTGTWNGIAAVVSFVWNAIVAYVTFYINALLTTITAVVGFISGIWNGAWSNISAFFNNIWNGIIGTINGIGGAIGNAFNGVAGIVRGAFQNVVSTVRQVINQVISVVNGAIDGINSVAGSVGGALGLNISVGRIPMLAEGAIVSRPTVAMVGEGRYPEAVTPLAGPQYKKVAQAFASEVRGDSGGVHFHGPVTVRDERALVVEQEKAQTRARMSVGRVATA